MAVVLNQIGIRFMQITDPLRLALVQSALIWEDPDKNAEHLLGHIRSCGAQADVWILPEMFSTGFTMNTLAAHKHNEEVIAIMLPVAKECGAAICGSAMVREKGSYYNRFYWVDPTGNYHTYDKRHTFRMAGEHEKFTAGSRREIITYKGWKIMPQVCYDLRFPVWSRNFLQEGVYGYDVLLYVANWPERRRSAWNALLPARAVENQAYVAAVNRVGTDGNGVAFSGDSAGYDYLGNRLGGVTPFTEGVQVISLSFTDLAEYRKSFPAMMDADTFTLL